MSTGRVGGSRSGARRLVGALTLVVSGALACAEVGTNPETPAAIELPPFPSPSVVVGDTLRDLDGNVTPIVAIVRNIRGDVISGADVRYLYADFARDTALQIDPVTGIVFAGRAATGEARIAARVGTTLQVLRTLTVTLRPDSMDAQARVIALLTTVVPDTGREAAGRNTSQGMQVNVRHRPAAGGVAAVNAWPVRYRIVRPANAGNDTTAAAFLVDDQGRPSALDTTNSSGNAIRRVRVRAAQFPTSFAVDSVIVEATASYRGVPLAGAPVRFAVPVSRPAVPGLPGAGL